MTNNELKKTVSELKELKALREELDAEISALEDAIKMHMGDQEQLIAGPYKISWKTISTQRLDSKAIMAAVPDFCQSFIKTVTTRRFTIA